VLLASMPNALLLVRPSKTQLTWSQQTIMTSLCLIIVC